MFIYVITVIRLRNILITSLIWVFRTDVRNEHILNVRGFSSNFRIKVKSTGLKSSLLYHSLQM